MNIRAMQDGDLEAVIQLLSAALGPAPGGVDRRSLFEWKHLANPAGRSIGLIGEQDGEICGVRMFMRWTFRRAAEQSAGGTTVAAVRAVDTATDPTLGRRGVFTALTKAALSEAEEQRVAFVFNTPNEKSRPGYLKMGWSDVARWPVWIGVRRPHKLALAASRRNLAGGPAMPPPEGSRLRPAGETLSDPRAGDLCRRANLPANGLFTDRSPDFLRWRYADGPIAYHALTLEGREPKGGQGAPSVMIIVRLRFRGDLREAVVCEVLALPGAEEAAGEALRGVAAEANADHAVAHFGAAWPWGAVLSGAGFRRLPRSGVHFTVRPLAAEPRAEAGSLLDPANWALGPGDLELF